MLDKKVPEIRITMPESSWNEMVEKAQIEYQSDRTGFGVEADMKFIYEKNEEDFKINFKLGGKSTTSFSKPGYNIKIKDGKNLHGTKNFRLRSDQRDVSMMRSKITTDILQKSGLIAVETGYTELYVNDEYMGLWVISDSIKNHWIKRKFGDNGEEIKTLYECNGDVIRFDDGSAKTKCINKNDEYSDYMEPFNTFVDQVNAAKTRQDLEEIMDVDNFIKYMAWEWLMGSFDHFLSYYGHNLCWYKQPNDKWIYIPYDHDIEMGQDEYIGFYPNRTFNHGNDIDFTNLSFKEFELDHPIIQVLINDDDTVFRELLDDIISKVFNPDTLLLHIDEVRSLIGPYVKKDRESGAGKINKIGKDTRFTYDHFLLNTEYTYIYDWITGFRSYGLKDWIRRRYNFAAAYYGINTNSTSSNEKHKLIEPRPEPIKYSYRTIVFMDEADIEEIYYLNFDNKYLPEYTPDEGYADDRIPILGVNQYNLEREESINSTINNNSTETSTTQPSLDENVCWSEALGYKCCSSGCNSIVIFTDENGSWSAENNEWCGIPASCDYSECPGLKLGYKCCKDCVVFSEDDDGLWGIENNYWCSIKPTCNL
ncbi:coth-domain-containing protein [Piromyces finnis]|uniref:Coth-domain-containing protein n=1 Tax=Piromyces finnis TaxID=1754191 RepID=A0A1Y1VP73_9FUNG|nr:coth-domain-containing protein [Piromyces finnis]|eukprot:ORX61215.1 coth-domain-containing protein [Piromyces finnis]